jgi:hypothetical protein
MVRLRPSAHALCMTATAVLGILAGWTLVAVTLGLLLGRLIAVGQGGDRVKERALADGAPPAADPDAAVAVPSQRLSPADEATAGTAAGPISPGV